MKEAFAILLYDRPVWIGAFGTLGTVMLERFHLVVGIAVGLTTIVYLVIRIRKELETERRAGKPARVRRMDSGGCPSGDRGRE